MGKKATAAVRFGPDHSPPSTPVGETADIGTSRKKARTTRSTTRAMVSTPFPTCQSSRAGAAPLSSIPEKKKKKATVKERLGPDHSPSNLRDTTQEGGSLKNTRTTRSMTRAMVSTQYRTSQPYRDAPALLSSSPDKKTKKATAEERFGPNRSPSNLRDTTQEGGSRKKPRTTRATTRAMTRGTAPALYRASQPYRNTAVHSSSSPEKLSASSPLPSTAHGYNLRPRKHVVSSTPAGSSRKRQRSRFGSLVQLKTPGGDAILPFPASGASAAIESFSLADHLAAKKKDLLVEVQEDEEESLVKEQRDVQEETQPIEEENPELPVEADGQELSQDQEDRPEEDQLAEGVKEPLEKGKEAYQLAEEVEKTRVEVEAEDQQAQTDEQSQAEEEQMNQLVEDSEEYPSEEEVVEEEDQLSEDEQKLEPEDEEDELDESSSEDHSANPFSRKMRNVPFHKRFGFDDPASSVSISPFRPRHPFRTPGGTDSSRYEDSYEESSGSSPLLPPRTQNRLPKGTPFRGRGILARFKSPGGPPIAHRDDSEDSEESEEPGFEGSMAEGSGEVDTSTEEDQMSPTSSEEDQLEHSSNSNQLREKYLKNFEPTSSHEDSEEDLRTKSIRYIGSSDGSIEKLSKSPEDVFQVKGKKPDSNPSTSGNFVLVGSSFEIEQSPTGSSDTSEVVLRDDQLDDNVSASPSFSKGSKPPKPL